MSTWTVMNTGSPAGEGEVDAVGGAGDGAGVQGGGQALGGDGGAGDQAVAPAQLTPAVYQNGPVRVWSLRSRPS